MSFGNDFGRQTPIGAGIGGGLIQGLLGFLKQRQDAQAQAKQDKMDTLRQALLTQQISQGAQTFQSNQADAATERQRRATQDVQDQRAPMLGLLSHLISQGPQNPGVVANAYQQYQSTGQLPSQVPIYPNLPLPGASGGGPTAVNLPGSLSSIYSAAGAPQSERDFLERQRQAREIAGQNLDFKREHDSYQTQLATLREQAKARIAGTKDRNAFYQKTHDAFVKGGIKLEDLQPAMQEAMDNWDHVNGGEGAAAGAANQPGRPLPYPFMNQALGDLFRGVGARPPSSLVGPQAAAAPGPTGALPGVQAGIDAKTAAGQLATARATNIPLELQRKQDQDAWRKQVAQQRADDYSQATNALTDYRATMAGVAQGKLTLADAAQKHKIAMDSTGTFLQRAQAHLASVRATLALSQNSPQVQAAKAQLASLDKTRGILQKRYDDMANQIAAKSTQPLAVGQTAQGLANQLKAMQDLAGTLKGGLDAIDTQAAGALTTIRAGAPAAPPAASTKPAPAPPGGWAPALKPKRVQYVDLFRKTNGRAPTPAEAADIYHRVELPAGDPNRLP